ncbi:MAG: DUF2868 domain-containing protein [Pseudomonadota bacterium]
MAESRASTGKPSFTGRWIAEAVRLHERRHGRLDDSREVDHLLDGKDPVEQRIVRRAQVLAERIGLGEAVQQWRTGLRWGLAGLALIAVFTGFGAALAVLGDGQRSVNIIWTLAALLGLNLLMLILWLVGMLFGGRASGGALGRSWLQMARWPGGARRGIAARAWYSLGTECNAHRWMLGSVTHGFWCLYTLAAVLALLLALSLRAYEFVWETTILSSDVFVRFVQWSAWLPARIGFAVPDESMVRASQLAAETAGGESLRRIWSSWLLGCLVIYGLLPRLILLLASAAMLLFRVRRCRLDLHSPEWAVLATRLAPASEQGGVVDPDTMQAGIPDLQLDPDASGVPAVLAAELGDDIPWPPADWSVARLEYLGPADDRDRRQAVQQRLQDIRPARLLFAVDARLSPDRGLMNWLLRQCGFSAACGVWLIHADQADTGRLQSWRHTLAANGFAPSMQYMDAPGARQWLVRGGDA